MKHHLLIILSALFCGPSCPARENLELNSSDPRLNDAFAWARKTALSYTRANDPVGKWYEAALPGRESFCMRDVSHQATGAYYLGLDDCNKNMLAQFARNISPSRAWCSYWEINKYDKPTPVDYTSDDDFWYNLPANFDVMSACFDLYNLTGDRDYLLGEPFFSFHRHSVTDYVKTWDADQNGILESPRAKKIARRGIGSYEEGFPGIATGSDLLAAQAKGYAVFAEIMKLTHQPESTKTYRDLSQRLEKEYLQNWWDAENRCFYGYKMHDGKFNSKRNDVFVLHFDLIRDPARIAAILTHLEQDREDGDGRDAVEGNSYLPLLFYKYGQPDIAYRRLLYMADPNLERRVYPEVSYVFIGDVVQGLMGVELHAPENRVQTTPKLPRGLNWAEVKYIPWKTGYVTVKHTGLSATTLDSGAAAPLTWRAVFPGTQTGLWVNHKKVKAQSARAFNGESLSYTDIPIAPGDSCTVSITEESDDKK